MPENADENHSALELYRQGRYVERSDVFKEILADLLGLINRSHPLPALMDYRFLYGSMAEHEPELVDMFWWTLEFLEHEGLIRGVPARPRVMNVSKGTGDDIVGFVMSLKGLAMLEQRPPELFGAAQGASIGELLANAAGEGASDASKALARTAIEWAFRNIVDYLCR